MFLEGNFEKFMPRWQKQIETNYKDLSKEDKNKDREQVMKYWHIIDQAIQSAKKEGYDKGFIDGADQTGRIAEEELAEREHEAKKEAVEECIEKIDDYGDKLVREGAEEQSDYYMGELNAVSRIKEILFVGGGKKWLCGKCENDKLPKHSRHCDKS